MTQTFLRKHGAPTMIDGVVLYESGSEDARVNPTLTVGDARISKDGGPFVDLISLPTVLPAGGRAVRVSLAASELECARAAIQFVDQSITKEWADRLIIVETFGAPVAQHAGIDWTQPTLEDLYEGFRTLFVAAPADALAAAPPPTASSFALASSAPAVAGALDECVLIFVTGALAGLQRTIVAYSAARQVTVEPPFAQAPAAGDFYAVCRRTRTRLADSGVAAVADGLLDRADAIEAGLTLRGSIRLIAAATAGPLSGASGSTIAIRNAVANSKTRITASVDAYGNRTVVATDTT